MTRRVCATWADHDWASRVFLEAGRHHTMGRFNKYIVTCTRCGQTTIETRWLELPPTPMRFAAWYPEDRRRL